MIKTFVDKLEDTLYEYEDKFIEEKQENLSEGIEHLTVEELERLYHRMHGEENIDQVKVAKLKKLIAARKVQESARDMAAKDSGEVKSMQRKEKAGGPQDHEESVRNYIKKNKRWIRDQNASVNDNKTRHYVDKFNEDEPAIPFGSMKGRDFYVHKKPYVEPESKTGEQENKKQFDLRKAIAQQKSAVPSRYHEMASDMYSPSIGEKVRRFDAILADMHGADPHATRKLLTILHNPKNIYNSNHFDNAMTYSKHPSWSGMVKIAKDVHKQIRKEVSIKDGLPTSMVIAKRLGKNTENPKLSQLNPRYKVIRASANLLKKIILKNPNILNEMSSDIKRQIIRILIEGFVSNVVMPSVAMVAVPMGIQAIANKFKKRENENKEDLAKELVKKGKDKPKIINEDLLENFELAVNLNPHVDKRLLRTKLKEINNKRIKFPRAGLEYSQQLKSARLHPKTPMVTNQHLDSIVLEAIDPAEFHAMKGSKIPREAWHLTPEKFLEHRFPATLELHSRSSESKNPNATPEQRQNSLALANLLGDDLSRQYAEGAVNAADENERARYNAAFNGKMEDWHKAGLGIKDMEDLAAAHHERNKTKKQEDITPEQFDKIQVKIKNYLHDKLSQGGRNPSNSKRQLFVKTELRRIVEDPALDEAVSHIRTHGKNADQKHVNYFNKSMRDLKLLRNDATSLNKKAAKGTTKIAAKKTTMAKADKEEMKNAIGDYSRNATKPAYFNPKVAETPIPELRGTTPESAPNLTQTPRVVVRKAPQNVVQPQAQQPQTNTQPVPQTKTQQTQVQQPKPKPQASNPNQQQQPITSMKPTVQTWAVGNPRIDGLDSAKETGMLPKFLDKVDKLNKEKK